ncbi:MAG: hypothetical protein MIO93_01060 [ANME-2 cluster archaeon]|nr:hypothetical protein [ANME-2 cluster archaeon]
MQSILSFIYPISGISLEMDESINRAVMRDDKFNSLVKQGIDVFLTHVGRFKRKSRLN